MSNLCGFSQLFLVLFSFLGFKVLTSETLCLFFHGLELFLNSFLLSYEIIQLCLKLTWGDNYF